jgi:hypothetical protein
MMQNLSVSDQEAMKRDIIADLHVLEEKLISFLQSVEPQAWSRKMRPYRRGEWTLAETMAHLVTVAEFYVSAIQHTVRQEIVQTPGFTRRQDLPGYNQQAIRLRQHLQPAQLITALQGALLRTCELAEQITPEQLLWPVQMPVFNRYPTLLEVLETQATHPGMVHGAQLTVPARVDPIWRSFEGDVMHRMLTRFFHLMTLIYWPERGGGKRATLQFVVEGAGGGEWYIRFSPTECQTGEGRSSDPRITTIQAVSADALCCVFMRKISVSQALVSRKIALKGDILLASRLLFLFSPT